MHKTVLRVAPVTQSNLTGMSHHHARTHSETDVHVDHDLSKNNLTLIGSGDPESDVNDLVSQYRQAKKSDDPIVAAEYILTAGKDYFDEDFPGWKSDSSVLQPWIDANLDFIRSKSHILGEPVSAVLHLDEEAPHIHLATVPIADVRIANRYSSRIDQRLSYSALLYDDRSTLAEARRLGRVDTDTKLGRIQTIYADDMQSHGLNLERGISQSGAVHVSPGQHRADISRPLPEQITTLEEAQVVLQQAQASSNERKILMKEKADLKKTVKKLLTDREKLLADRLKEDKDLLRLYRGLSENDMISGGFATRAEVNEFNAQSKRKTFNGIDFVCWKEDCGFDAAVLTLAGHFNKERISESVAETVMTVKVSQARTETLETKSKIETIIKNHETDPSHTIKPQKRTKSDRAKESIINRQLSAIHAPLYRVTLMHPTPGKTMNVGKGKGIDGDERFYTASEVMDLIPTLSARNAHGYNIFITPIPTNDNKHFILLDDIRDTKKADEISPCLTIQTSPASQQALYRMEGTKQAAELVFTALNQEIGDPKISGQIHPLRLVGFTNRKAKYKDENGLYPFVEVLTATDRDSSTLTRWGKMLEEQQQKKIDASHKQQTRSGHNSGVHF